MREDTNAIVMGDKYTKEEFDAGYELSKATGKPMFFPSGSEMTQKDQEAQEDACREAFLRLEPDHDNDWLSFADGWQAALAWRDVEK